MQGPLPAEGLIRTVEYDPFIKSQLPSLEGLMWCKFGHFTLQNLEGTQPSYSNEC